MAKLYIISRDRTATTFGIEGYPDISIVARTLRNPKAGGAGKKLTNAVSEVLINAQVGVPTCGTSNACSQELLVTRTRLSGSMQNASKRAALHDIHSKLVSALEARFKTGESLEVPSELSVDAELKVLYPTPK